MPSRKQWAVLETKRSRMGGPVQLDLKRCAKRWASSLRVGPFKILMSTYSRLLRTSNARSLRVQTPIRNQWSCTIRLNLRMSQYTRPFQCTTSSPVAGLETSARPHLPLSGRMRVLGHKVRRTRLGLGGQVLVSYLNYENNLR